ncbi:MAG: cupin domain-containing protein [Deltaproteobacteria bacterium]|nr:cupin domain-containing protein [Deltaproteobacteria bacterium]
MKPSNIVNQDQIAWTEAAQGKFRYRRKAFTALAGMERLGASLYELEPGASAFPRHYHCANEEAIFVLEGEGVLALGDSQTPVRAGDFIALPRGPEHAHRLSNRSQSPLRYLCFSTMIEPDVAVYSDSNKVGFFAGSAPGGAKEKRRLTGVFRRDSEVGYFDGEADA